MIRTIHAITAALSGLLSVLLATSGFTLVAAATAHAQAQSARVSWPLSRAIDQLPVAAETRAGYDRDLFTHWVDADADCQDTRDEVLAAESRVTVAGCDIQRGHWRSYYDGVTTRDSTGFDIDHLVPLAEAWDSGARRWNPATRQRFANDLHDPRTLVAVTASSNRSKSDRDPAEWMPTLAGCKYVRQWVAVKIRWRLTVDRAEKQALRSHARGCANTTLTVTRATIRTRDTSNTSSPTPDPTPTGGVDPRYGTCTEAIANGYGPYVQGVDPEYDWYIDGDNDGTVCE